MISERTGSPSGPYPLSKLATTLADHRASILTYIDHRVTSATCEGINSVIQELKHRSRGFRNRENFKRVQLSC